MENSTKYRQSIYSSWEYVLIIASIPIIQFIEFILTNKGNLSNPKPVENSIIPTFYLFVFVLNVVKSKFNLAQVFLLIYFILYVILFNDFSLQNNASYMIAFVVTCSTLLCLSDNSLVVLGKKQDSILIILFFVVIFLYYLFSHERFFEDRFYLVGFVIPHQFSYYCAIFTFYLLSRRRLGLALLVTVAGIYVGVRSGLLAMLICYTYYFLNRNSIEKLGLIFRALLIAIILLSSFIKIEFLAKFSTLLTKTFNVSSAANNAEYTSSRSVIWFNMLQKVARDGVSSENLLGRGPRSTYQFNLKTFGTSIWMHNDFFEIFFSLGVIGILLYLYSLYKYYISSKDIYLLLFFLVLIITNGFFTYTPITMIFLHKIISSNKKLNLN